MSDKPQHRPIDEHQKTAVQAKTLELRLGYNINTDSALHAAAVRFSEEVKRSSGGKVLVSLHPNQELGNDHQMLEMARKGELDMVLTPTAKLSVAVPEMQYADLPFFFSSHEELYSMLDGAPGDALLKKLGRIGLIGVAFWENGFKHFTANKPLRTPADFAGTKFRIMKSRMLVDQFQNLGATPIPIDFHATRQALADGAVDGQENPLVAIVGMKFHEVQSHLTLSSHGYLGYAFSISSQVFTTLPPEMRELLIDTARELSSWEREETQRREQGYLAEIRAAGVEVHELTSAERKAFSDHLAHLPDQYEQVIGPDLLAKTRELRWRALPAAQRDHELVIGLDADLSSAGSLSGLAIRRGIDIAVTEINQQGGLLGRPLRLVALDHRGTPSTGLKNLRELGSLPNLLAVIGGMHSFVVSEEMDAIHELRIPYLIPWAAASNLTDNGRSPNYIFRCSIADKLATPFLLDSAVAGGRKVGMLLERSTWGRSNETAAQEWAAKNGGLVDIHWFNRGEVDFLPTLRALEKQGIDTLVMVANPHESVAILKAVTKMSTPPVIYAHWGLTGGDFWASAKHLLEQVDLNFIQTITFNPEPSERLKPLLKHYRGRYNLSETDNIPAPLGTVHAYELMNMLARAVEMAGSADHAAVRDALENIGNYKGVIRDYSMPFSPLHHDALGAESLTLARFDAEGRIVPVTKK